MSAERKEQLAIVERLVKDASDKFSCMESYYQLSDNNIPDWNDLRQMEETVGAVISALVLVVRVLNTPDGGS